MAMYELAFNKTQVDLLKQKPVFLPKPDETKGTNGKFIFNPRRHWGTGNQEFISLRKMFDDLWNANSLASSFVNYRDNSRRRESDIWLLYMPDVANCGEFLYRLESTPTSEICLWLGCIYAVTPSGCPLSSRDEVTLAEYAHLSIPFSTLMNPLRVHWNQARDASEHDCLKRIWVVRLDEVVFNYQGPNPPRPTEGPNPRPILRIRACESLLVWRTQRFAVKLWKHPIKKDVVLKQLKPNEPEQRWHDIEVNGKPGKDGVIHGVTFKAPKGNKVRGGKGGARGGGGGGKGGGAGKQRGGRGLGGENSGKGGAQGGTRNRNGCKRNHNNDEEKEDVSSSISVDSSSDDMDGGKKEGATGQKGRGVAKQQKRRGGGGRGGRGRGGRKGGGTRKRKGRKKDSDEDEEEDEMSSTLSFDSDDVDSNADSIPDCFVEPDSDSEDQNLNDEQRFELRDPYVFPEVRRSGTMQRWEDDGGEVMCLPSTSGSRTFISYATANRRTIKVIEPNLSRAHSGLVTKIEICLDGNGVDTFEVGDCVRLCYCDKWHVYDIGCNSVFTALIRSFYKFEDMVYVAFQFLYPKEVAEDHAPWDEKESGSWDPCGKLWKDFEWHPKDLVLDDSVWGWDWQDEELFSNRKKGAKGRKDNVLPYKEISERQREEENKSTNFCYTSKRILEKIKVFRHVDDFKKALGTHDDCHDDTHFLLRRAFDNQTNKDKSPKEVEELFKDAAIRFVPIK
jgi:hypothetical protein